MAENTGEAPDCTNRKRRSSEDFCMTADESKKYGDCRQSPYQNLGSSYMSIKIILFYHKRIIGDYLGIIVGYGPAACLWPLGNEGSKEDQDQRRCSSERRRKPKGLPRKRQNRKPLRLPVCQKSRSKEARRTKIQKTEERCDRKRRAPRQASD